MRFREIPIVLIAPLGMAAALMTHALLQAVADYHLGAPAFASRAHTAVEPVMFLEVALALWLAGIALRDALTTRAQPSYNIASPPRLGSSRLTLCGGLVALIAMATLFGMEYCESGSAAFGLGWLGGALMPGAVALTIAVTWAVGLIHMALAGHLAAFDRFVALFAATLARFIATPFAPAPALQRVRPRRLTAGATPVARHAGVRAPPKTPR